MCVYCVCVSNGVFNLLNWIAFINIVVCVCVCMYVCVHIHADQADTA